MVVEWTEVAAAEAEEAEEVLLEEDAEECAEEEAVLVELLRLL